MLAAGSPIRQYSQIDFAWAADFVDDRKINGAGCGDSELSEISILPI
jgi:hypothetical protein